MGNIFGDLPCKKRLQLLLRPVPSVSKKIRPANFGHLPPKVAEVTPWDKVFVDLMDPYKFRCKRQPTLECISVTAIDPATG